MAGVLATSYAMAFGGLLMLARASATAGVDWVGALLLTSGLMSLILAASLLEHGRSLLAAVAGRGGQRPARAVRPQPADRPPPAAAPRRPARATPAGGAGTAFVNTATTSSAVTLATLYLQNARHVSPPRRG